MSFNSNCRILAAELNYRFTEYVYIASLNFILLESNYNLQAYSVTDI